jgi:two-component system, NarL family, nitrate/nitrite response regulator NarL
MGRPAGTGEDVVQTSLSYDRKIGVAIRSNRRLFRDALAACLSSQPEFTVVGHVADDADLLHLCDLRHPDLVLFDTGSGTGITGSLGPLATLRSRYDRTRVVVVYEQLSPADLAATWQIGVDTLIPCSHGLDALLVVLHQHANAVRSLAGMATPDGGLTDQEREIITLIGAGHTVSRIAELLGLSTFTVENCKRRIYHKLDVASQSHAIARAAALGLVGRPPLPSPKVTKPGGVMLVVLRGPDTPARHHVVVALLASRIPFVMDGAGQRGETSGGRGGGDWKDTAWDRWHRGPVLLVLVDPGPSDWDGLEESRIPVLLVRSGGMRRGETLETLGRGVLGIVAEDRVGDALVPALTLAAAGHLTVDPTATSALLAAIRARSGEPAGWLPELTARECDILRSIAAGHTVRQTARSLGIAEKTVENTQARLFRKLGARNRAGAVATAHALGLLELVAPGSPPPAIPAPAIRAPAIPAPRPAQVPVGGRTGHIQPVSHRASAS